MTIHFDKRGCRQVLKKNPSLEKKIAQVIENQKENSFFKTKAASDLKWNGLKVLECRVNDPSVGAIRCAFTVDPDGGIDVVYLSSTLLKKDFTAELNRFLKRGS